MATDKKPAMAEGRPPTSRPPTTIERQITMAEVARLAGVAESTVSRALAGSPLVAEKTRQHIIDISEQAGYSVNAAARNLRIGSTGTLELVIQRDRGEERSLSDPFFLEMIGVVGDEAAAAGYDLLLSTTLPWRGKRPGNSITAGRADGIIVIGQGDSRAELNEFARKHRQLIVWGGTFKDDIYPVIGSDNQHGGRLATRHLINIGRQNLAFLGDVNHPEVRQRFDGFMAEHRAAGVIFDEGLMVHTPWDPRQVPLAVQRLMQSGIPFNGVVCASDAIAAVAINTLQRGGRRVPDDTAVIGFDDVLMSSQTNPALTTIRQNIPAGGAMLVQSLLALIKGYDARGEMMSPQLIVRESCGARAYKMQGNARSPDADKRVIQRR